MTDHPITPPPELVEQWVQATESNDCIGAFPTNFEKRICTAAAQWGADQELLACGNYLEKCASWEPEDVTEFYNYRRPRPLGLKELALASLKRFEESGEFFSYQMRELAFIRKALEQLDD